MSRLEDLEQAITARGPGLAQAQDILILIEELRRLQVDVAHLGAPKPRRPSLASRSPHTRPSET